MDAEAEKDAIREALENVAVEVWPPTQQDYRDIVSGLGTRRGWSERQIAAATENVLANLAVDCWCDESCGDPDCCGGPFQQAGDCSQCIHRYATDVVRERAPAAKTE